MRLDFNPANKLYTLTVDPRVDGLTVQELRESYGLDYWSEASTPFEQVFSTPQPYAAATFVNFATERAREGLDWIAREVIASRAENSGRHFDVPEDCELWDFQKADLEYMLRRTHSLDADEPGLGKTPTAIAYANEIQAQRVLVVCPASIRFQWLRRIIGTETEPGWSTMNRTYKVPDARVYAVVNGRGGVHPNAAWTVVSYELARSPGILDALRKTDYDLLVLDEVHYLKTVGSKRTRAIFGGGHDPLYHEALAEKAAHVVALSGTPLPNRPREIYPLARHLAFDSIDWLSEDKFGDRFNPIAYHEVDKKIPRLGGGFDTLTVLVPDEASGRHAELQNRLRAHFMTRHLKRSVMKQLKYPVYDLVRVEETAPVRAALRVESMLQIDPEHLEGADAVVLGHIAEARRIMGEAMAPQTAAYAHTIIEGGVEKLVIFYWHISVGAILIDQLTKKLGEGSIVRVDGRTSPVIKDALVQRFVHDPACKVIIGNVMSLGTGTDGLQLVCGHTILAEADWTPGNNQQCIDRLDRGGQTRQVLADIMVAPGSIAEKVLASALRKLKVTHNALDRQVA